MSVVTLLALWQALCIVLPTLPAAVALCSAAGLMSLALLWRARAPAATIRHDGAGLWSVSTSRYSIDGRLAQGCFRSQWLLILAIRASDGKLQRIAIWHDAVDPRDFSYLHLMMMTTDLTTEQGTPER